MWSENILFMISVFESDETYFQLQYKVNFINYIYELEKIHILKVWGAVILISHL